MHTLDDIIPPSRRKETAPINNSTNREPRRSRFPYATLFVIVLVIAASIGALFYFSSAKVEVTPNTVSAAVQSSLTATQSTGSLPFEIITAQKTATQSVAGSGTKTVNSSASGTSTHYNTQTKTQQLIANTRFATAAGLIFRIHAAVTVPGGTSAKPGSITAKVFADQVGSSYNVAPTSFTIPGFAGTPQASQVYARSSEAMTGGSSGLVPVVDSSVEAKTRSALTAALGPDLAKNIKEQIPAGYVLVPGSAVTTYQELASAPSGTTGQVDVKEQGTITAIVFPNAVLAKAIASSVAGLSYQGEPLTLASTDGLLINLGNSVLNSDTPSYTFAISGTASLIYTVDPVHIAAAVAGETRSAAEVALTNYPEVKRAIIILRPFWRQTFPQDPSSISVVVTAAH
ncbi:MAG: hypothetical protein NTY93_00805 [Candidatus Kaiserbacteria bacterium]|nr:hypothetical protein [Candidatus Kaiserbacteria bacterium]